MSGLTDDERTALMKAIDAATLASTSTAAVAWGMPLLDIVQSEGHDHECDAVAAENLTACDCWWGKVKRAAEAMSVVATLADEQLALREAGDLFADVERIAQQREQAARDAALGPVEALIADAERTTYTPHTVYVDDLRAAIRDGRAT